MSRREGPTIDAETRRKLDEELKRHRAALEKAKDDIEVTVLCTHYIRRIGEILRSSLKRRSD